MSRNGWIMAATLVVCAAVFALVVAVDGIRDLIRTFGREETPSEKQAALKNCRIKMLTIRNAIEFYIFDTGIAPLELESLVSRPAGNERWNGPYIRRGRLPKPPWGRELRYELADNGFYLTASGPDRIFDASEMATLSPEEVKERFAYSNIVADNLDAYDPEADNVEVFHYHVGMSEIVPPGTPLRKGPDLRQVASILNPSQGMQPAASNGGSATAEEALFVGEATEDP